MLHCNSFYLYHYYLYGAPGQAQGLRMVWVEGGLEEDYFAEHCRVKFPFWAGVCEDPDALRETFLFPKMELDDTIV